MASCATTEAPKKKGHGKEYFSEKEYGVKASPRVVADGKPVPKGGGRFMVGQPYQVKGKTYVPKEDPDYNKSGLASWYGSAFHGRLTANGEVYDSDHLSAAHPTFPLPSYARVTNLDTGSSVVVRVNDRGPYHPGRIIDVSGKTADLLDMKRTGTARVNVQYVGRARMDGQDMPFLMASYTRKGDRLPSVQPEGQVASGVMVASNQPLREQLQAYGSQMPAPARLAPARAQVAAAGKRPAAGSSLPSAGPVPDDRAVVAVSQPRPQAQPRVVAAAAPVAAQARPAMQQAQVTSQPVQHRVAPVATARTTETAYVAPSDDRTPRDQPGFVSKAKQVYLVEESTETVLLAANENQAFPAASLAKLMTMEVVFNALKNGEVTTDTIYPVSEHAWRTGGAPSGTTTMFAALKSQVPVADLMKGVIVQNANDACIILAEGLAGSEVAFAARMTARARDLGLTRSSFGNATGLPYAESWTTARDLVTLSRHLHSHYPDHYALYAQPDFQWNKILQRNKNPLLGLNMGVDGLGAGFAEGTGYAVAASAERDGTRLFLAMGGLASDKERQEEARRILDWALSSFQTRILFKPDEVVGQASVYGGTRSNVDLITPAPIEVYVPKTNPDRCPRDGRTSACGQPERARGRCPVGINVLLAVTIVSPTPAMHYMPFLMELSAGTRVADRSGKFITFEGGEGVGKSTQIRRLADRLRRRGHDVLVTREPGGSPGAEAVRHVLLSGMAEDFGVRMEAILFAAARNDHVEEVIRPALETGAIVLCDRFLDSSRVYQGVTGNLEADFIETLQRIATNGVMPDLTFILDLSAEAGLARARSRSGGVAPDRFEREEIETHEKRRRAYLDIAASEPARCRIIDAAGTLDDIEEEIASLVEPILSATHHGRVSAEPVARAGHFFSQTSGTGNRRIVIIDPADDLNRNAANAILKILEEPPRGAMFLVLSHAPGKLLPTIRSRCQTLRLSPLTDDDVRHALSALGQPLDGGRTEEAVLSLAKGSVSRALRLLNYGGLDIIAAFDEVVQANGPAARKAMHRLSDVLSAKDSDVIFGFFVEHLGEHLVERARLAARSGQLAAAAKQARLVSEINEKLAISAGYNLDRKQTLLSILEAARTA
eukprot:g19948.t1